MYESTASADEGCVPRYPRVHQQLRRADGPLRYGGLIFTVPLSGATFPVTTCACRQPLDKDHITEG